MTPPFTVDITCGLAKREGAPVYGTHRSGVGVLPTGVALRFTGQHQRAAAVQHPLDRPERGRRGLGGKSDGLAAGQRGVERWTSTVYRSDHSMVCQIHQGGVVLAEAVHRVRIRDEARRGFFRRR